MQLSVICSKPIASAVHFCIECNALVEVSGHVTGRRVTVGCNLRRPQPIN